MEKQKNSQMLVIVVLSIVLLTMSVGFANFSSILNINGNVTVKSASWNVHFVANSYAETTGSVAVTSKNISDTSMSYNVTLEKPGDFYEFTVNVANEGTFDANLTKITLSSLSDAQKKYLTYSLTYNNGTTYTATTDGLSLLLAKETGVAPVKVRVEYIQPNDSADLPATTASVTLTASLDYNQAGLASSN